MDTQWIKEGLKAAGKSQVGLADALGIAPSGVSRLISGQRKIKASELQTLCSYLECYPPEQQLWPENFYNLRGERPGPPARERYIGGLSEQGASRQTWSPLAAQSEYRSAPKQTLALLERDLPISGLALGGHGSGASGPGAICEDERFYFNGETVGFLRRPPGLFGAPNAFALYVIGDSMAPRYEAGDLIYLDPNRPVRDGDYVVIELHSPNESNNLEPGSGGEPKNAGPCYVKRLLRRRAETLVASQFNPAGELTFHNKNIRSIYRILTTSELLGA